MIVGISAAAEADIAEGYWFYERQSAGLGDYFRTCIFADVESLMYFAGVMKRNLDFIGRLAKAFRVVSTTRWMPTM